MVHALLGLVELFLACLPVYVVLVWVDKALAWVGRYLFTRFVNIIYTVKERVDVLVS